MASLAARVYDTAVGPIEAAVVGDGPPTLLVHGALGSWRQLQTLAEDLAARHRVVLVTRPGYGRTPPDGRATDEQQAAAYAAFTDRLGMARLDLVGVSAGAPSCIAFARRWPARIGALVLCAPLAPHLASTRGMWAAQLPLVVDAWLAFDRRRRHASLGDPARAVRSALPELSATERERIADPAVARDVADFVRWTAEGPPGADGLRNDIWNIRHSRRLAAEPLAARALLIHGECDRSVPLEHARWYLSAMAGASLTVVPGAAHLILHTFRRETSALIATFLGSPA